MRSPLLDAQHTLTTHPCGEGVVLVPCGSSPVAQVVQEVAESDVSDDEESDSEADEDAELLHKVTCIGKYIYRQAHPTQQMLNYRAITEALQEAATAAKKKRPAGVTVTTYEYLDIPEAKRRLVLAVRGPPEESLADAAVMALASACGVLAE